MSAEPVQTQNSCLAAADRRDYSKAIGTELRGLNLLALSDADVVDLKRLLAERCVLVFRDQRMTREAQVEMGRRFGRLHIHPAIADKTYPEALRIHADAESQYAEGERWHTDVSCDLEPPGISMLRIEVTPSCGGDTAFASMYMAWERLSKPIQELLLGLEAIHSGEAPYKRRVANITPQQKPVNVHPVVRTHPITGRRALFVNSGFTTRIVGLSDRESSALLRMLFEHIQSGVVFQCRVRWEPHTLTMWDNRCVQHFASWDYFPDTRTGWRVTTVGERPYLQR